MPIASATVEQIWRQKMSEKPHSIRFLDDSTSANKGAGKSIEKPLNQTKSAYQKQDKSSMLVPMVCLICSYLSHDPGYFYLSFV